MMSEEKNQELKETQHQEINKSEKELSKKQVIFYSALLAIAITICILSMIGINLFALLIIIGIVLAYVYMDEDIRKGDITDCLNDNNEIEN
jgi:Mg2+/citrate symporter